MVLFLFEHEQRKLYGVFEAISDGGLNIVPNAYSSYGKQFSAQVRISTIWSCHPLSEPEFRGAIEDNYYTGYKFNFGLSRDQVSNLLWLFESKKVRIQKSLNQSSESKVGKRHRMSSGKGFEKGRSSAGESSKEKLHMKIVTESIIATGDTKVSQSSLNSSTNSDHAIQEREDSGADSEHKMSSNTILTPSFQNSSGLGSSLGSTSILEAIDQFLSSFRSQPISSCDEPKTFDVSSSSITADLGDYIPLSSPDHCDSTEAVDKDNVYGPVVPIIPVRIPSHEDVESSAVVVPPSNMDDRNVGSSCLESQSIGSAEQSDSDYNVVYPTAKGLYSDIPKEKTSVFSRLTSASKPIVQKKNSFTSADKTVKEIMDKLQQRHNNWRKKTSKEAMSTRDGNEDNAMKKRPSVFSRLKLDLKVNASQNEDNIKEDKSEDHIMSTSGNKMMSGPNSYIRKYDHDGNFNRSPQQTEIIKHASPTDEQDAWGSRRISNDSPCLNFEPRNEMLTEQSVTNGRGCTESFDSESSFEKQCKKRKLVEQNSSDFNGGNCLNVQMTSQESSSLNGSVGIDEKNHASHEDLPLSMRSPVRILEQESRQHFDK